MEQTRLVAGLYHSLFGNINAFAMENEMKGLFLKKRQRVQTSDAYMEVMIGNVTYFNQVNACYLEMIEDMLRKKQFLSQREMEAKAAGIIARYKGNLHPYDQAVREELFRKHQTEYARIEELEFSYTYRKVENMLLSEVLLALVYPPNHRQLQPLFSSHSFYLEEFKKYTHLYTNFLIKNISYSGPK